MNKYQPDMLDDVAAHRAMTEPAVRPEWNATLIVGQLRLVREARGLAQADVAAKMGLPQQRIAEIERRPWATNFARILAYAQALDVELVVQRPAERQQITA